MSKAKKWFTPMFDMESEVMENGKNKEQTADSNLLDDNDMEVAVNTSIQAHMANKTNWMKNFDPSGVDDLAVHNKKIQDVENWLCGMCDSNRGEILLLSGPVGSGKTATLTVLALKHGIKISEWITPLDIDFPTDYGEYEFREKQSTKFLDFIISAANFTSLIDNNSKKVVLVEDMPNTFLRTPTEFSNVLQQYKERAKSPIVFICSDSNTDSKNTALNLFTASIKEQFNIQHITFNSISITGLRSALKRVADIISKKYSSAYTTPNAEVIECVVNSSGGDVRSAVLNLHFACLKGAKQELDTSLIDKEQKTKTKRKRKQVASKFMSIGKYETVSILHAVGRVLNPKKTENSDKFTHEPTEVIEQFLGQPMSFVSFLKENYLPHFGSIDDVNKAASYLSLSDYLLSEWREKFCQEYGIYIAVAGLMLSNKTPVSAWNPVRGPKNMRIQYPNTSDLPLLDQNMLYKGKTLISDYKTYCNIIGSTTNNR